MLSVEDIENVLLVGHETRGFEFKGPGDRTDSYLLAKAARAALSLGNLRDGGYIIIGIDDRDPASLGPGLDDDQLESWTDFDNLSRKLAVYADPPLRFEIEGMTLSSDSRVVVIQVHEFADVPHLCGKAYEDVLRKGALYVRTRRVPETAEVADSVEMRDVLELAIEKGVRRFVEMAARAGLPLRVPDVAPPAEDDEDRYDAERERGWA
jgi:predicted HTH transcriptional regulator